MSYIRHKAEESLEDYLETILILSSRLSVVRSIDVATELDFSKPSVSVAVKNLKNRGYITVSEEGFLHLTDEGRKIAESVYERHTLLTDWLVHLGVDPVIAAGDATCYNRSCILFRLIASVEVLCKSAEDAGCKNPPTPSRISAVLKPTITL